MEEQVWRETTAAGGGPVYHGPSEPDAVRQALAVLRQAKPAGVRVARLVLFGPSTYQTAVAMAARGEDDE